MEFAMKTLGYTLFFFAGGQLVLLLHKMGAPLWASLLGGVALSSGAILFIKMVKEGKDE